MPWSVFPLAICRISGSWCLRGGLFFSLLLLFFLQKHVTMVAVIVKMAENQSGIMVASQFTLFLRRDDAIVITGREAIAEPSLQLHI